jgi:hypothetical protein
MNFTGFDGWTELQPIHSWDPRNGDTVRRRWRGTPNTMAALENSLRLLRVAYTREADEHGGYSLITATYGALETQPKGEALADTWSLLGNDMEKSLWDGPVARYLFNQAEWYDANGVPSPQYVNIRRDITDLVTGTKIMSELAWWDDANPLTKQFVGDLLKGADTTYISQWVLRHVQILARGCSIRPNAVNIDKVYATTDLLRAWEGVPANLALPFDVPTGIWLKKTPSFDQVAADKWQLTQEFWHADSYAKTAYEVVTQSPPS